MSDHDQLWTADEITWLRNNAYQVTVYQAAEYLGRTVRSVYAKTRSLNLFFRKKITVNVVNGVAMVHRPWTDEEVEYLSTHAATTTMAQMAKHLGRTYTSVAQKVRNSQLKHRSDRAPWSSQEVFQLLALSAKHNTDEVAKRIGRSRHAVRTKMRILGIKLFAGHYSLTSAAEHTGYDSTQLLRARDSLGQTWKRRRHSWTSRYLITDEQLEALCEYLKTERWGKKNVA